LKINFEGRYQHTSFLEDAEIGSPLLREYGKISSKVKIRNL